MLQIVRGNGFLDAGRVTDVVAFDVVSVARTALESSRGLASELSRAGGNRQRCEKEERQRAVFHLVLPWTDRTRIIVWAGQADSRYRGACLLASSGLDELSQVDFSLGSDGYTCCCLGWT